MLLLVSELLLSISDIIVLVLDLNSQAVLCLLELGVLSIELFKIVFQVLDRLFELLLLVIEFVDLRVGTIEIAVELFTFFLRSLNLIEKEIMRINCQSALIVQRSRGLFCRLGGLGCCRTGQQARSSVSRFRRFLS